MSETAPQTLDHDGIAARIPHRGPMCLLDSLVGWSDTAIHCRAVGHADLAHPLRSPQGLLAPCAIEYAAQAMALHGSLAAPAGAAARPGFLASARQVRLHVLRLDDVAGALQVHARRLAGDERQALYRFVVQDEAGRPLVDGRAAVVFDSPLSASTP